MDICSGLLTWFTFIFLQIAPLENFEEKQVLLYSLENYENTYLKVEVLSYRSQENDLEIELKIGYQGKASETFNIVSVLQRGKNWVLTSWKIGELEQLQNDFVLPKRNTTQQLFINEDANYFLEKQYAFKETQAFQYKTETQIITYEKTYFTASDFQVLLYSHPQRGLLRLQFPLLAPTITLYDSKTFQNDSLNSKKVNIKKQKNLKPFEEFSQSEGSKFEWRVVNDGVMGGLSKGKLSFTNEGVKFKGNLSLENNGGFSSIRTPKMSPLDLSNKSGISLRVKGDGRTYQFRLEADARYRGFWAVSFKANFETKKDEWIVIEIPFSSFKGSWRGRDLYNAKLNPAKIERFGVILADKDPGSFEIEIDWIRPFSDIEE